MNFFKNLCLDQYGLDENNIEQIDDYSFVVTKESWNYELALDFQEEMVKRVYDDKRYKVIIFTNHPHCLTLGRGLQRRTKADTTLVDFDESLRSQLSIPIYDIKRGGGITFHYPGQLVIYPILSLETHKRKVMDFLKEVLRDIKTSLVDLYGIENLSYENDLIGLWSGCQKVASIGLCSHKFVTYHGLALNLYRDDLMSKTLKSVYPCGISGDSYITLDQITDPSDNYFNDISDNFLKRMKLFI